MLLIYTDTSVIAYSNFLLYLLHQDSLFWLLLGTGYHEQTYQRRWRGHYSSVVLKPILSEISSLIWLSDFERGHLCFKHHWLHIFQFRECFAVKAICGGWRHHCVSYTLCLLHCSIHVCKVLCMHKLQVRPCEHLKSCPLITNAVVWKPFWQNQVVKQSCLGTSVSLQFRIVPKLSFSAFFPPPSDKEHTEVRSLPTLTEVLGDESQVTTSLTVLYPGLLTEE